MSVDKAAILTIYVVSGSMTGLPRSRFIDHEEHTEAYLGAGCLHHVGTALVRGILNASGGAFNPTPIPASNVRAE